MSAPRTSDANSLGLGALLASKRVVLVVGCGGVGKTTTAAALGLAGAMRGKRVLCLTIDPAKRLAQSLGLEEMNTEAQRIDPKRFRAAGVDVPGSLTVMMLDTKSTFDALVDALADTPEKRERIKSNVLYQYVATSLAGTQEYMAMEKLHAVKDDPNFDLVLLDTPPTTNALDFLDAPDKLVQAFDSAATRWFVQAMQSSGKFSLNLLAKTSAAILRGIGKLTGGGFLEQVAEFLSEINSLFGSWRERADEVASALRGDDVAYVLVTTPDPLCVREVLFFAERLKQQGMRRDAWVVNRVHPEYGALPSPSEIAKALSSRGVRLDPTAPGRLRKAAEDEGMLGKADALHLVGLEDAIRDEPSSQSASVRVPAFPFDIHDVAGLAKIAAILAPR